jgi:acyl dehydratase
MKAPSPEAWAVGQELAPEEIGPISRTMIALYAGGSNDHNSLHLDADCARAAGLPDVIGQGMLTMALLGRYITSFVPQRALVTLGLRFMAMSRVGEVLHCRARVVAVNSDPTGKRTASLEVTALRPGGEVLATGEAVVRLSCDENRD